MRSGVVVTFVRGDEFALKKMRIEKTERMMKREKMNGYFLSFIRFSTVILILSFFAEVFQE